MLLSALKKITPKKVKPMESFINIRTECNRATPEKNVIVQKCIVVTQIVLHILNSQKWIGLHLIFKKQTKQDEYNFKSSITELAIIS